MTDKKIRILIADDHVLIREGLRVILAAQPELKLVGEARDGNEAVSLSRALRPDVILLDLMMPHKDGLTAIREIKEINPEIKILVLTSFADDERVFPAIKAGALGYLLKDTPAEQLIQAVREVAEGRSFLHPVVAFKVLREFSQPAIADPLTEREVETLRLVARGLSNQEIAQKLNVNEHTVEKYVSSVLFKLHLANRTQATLYALRHKLIDLDDG